MVSAKKYFEANEIQQINSDIDQINANIKDISRLHERALVGVSQDENNKITRKLDLIQDQTNDSMNSVRMDLKNLSNETKRLGGSEAQSRQAQQGNAAKKLQAAAKNFSDIQTSAKQQYQKRMEREIRIGKLYFKKARPDASDRDVSRALEDTRAGSAFAQEMLNSRIGSQRKVLQEVQDRHEEMRKMEQSIEELATLFMDLQNLLEVSFN
jgi:syntaxin 1B/2/3